MRIHYGNCVLADDEAAHASSFRVNNSRVVDVTELVQSTEAYVKGRGNQQVSLSFAVTYQFADAAAAAQFAVGWPSVLPEQDNCLLYWDDLRVIYSSAALKSTVAAQVGSSLQIAYTLTAASVSMSGTIADYQLNSGTTAERPASPSDDDEYYDTTLGYDLIYDATAAAWKDRLGNLI